MQITNYFTDIVLRGPMIGSMLMCMTAGIVGVMIFLKRQSLVGETLSHSAYPGVIVGVFLAGILGIREDQESLITFFVMLGGFLTSLGALIAIYFLEKEFSIRSDSALCFILSGFFGIGITLASDLQFTYTSLYKNVQTYLFGQAATMSDIHIAIYGSFSLIIFLTLLLFYKELKTVIFNLEYAKSIGIPVRAINTIIFILIAASVVIGIRSVGVVLMSAMFVAPAAAARQFSERLSRMIALSALIGALSAFLGNYFSVELSLQYSQLVFPTGPMIVLFASFFCLSALTFSKKGVLTRWIKQLIFKYHSTCENILKFIWRLDGREVSFKKIKEHQHLSYLFLKYTLFRLKNKGWIYEDHSLFGLTKEGRIWAERVVRLHRLWEVYLADYVGIDAQKVHKSAEEMEHFITKDLEQELTLLLKNPQFDPHHQKIPQWDEEI